MVGQHLHSQFDVKSADFHPRKVNQRKSKWVPPVKQEPKPEPVKSLPQEAPKVVRLKYEMCKNFKEKGVCKYGDRCLFAHGDHELIKRGLPAGSKPETTAAAPKEEATSTDKGDNSTT